MHPAVEQNIEVIVCSGAERAIHASKMCLGRRTYSGEYRPRLQDHSLTQSWGHTNGFGKQLASAIAIDIGMVKEIMPISGRS